MAVVGKRWRHREKDLLKSRGYSWSPGESGRPRCWSRRVKRRQGGRGGLAPRKCDGAGSTGMGVADHGQRSIFGSMLGLG